MSALAWHTLAGRRCTSSTLVLVYGCGYQRGMLITSLLDSRTVGENILLLGALCPALFLFRLVTEQCYVSCFITNRTSEPAAVRSLLQRASVLRLLTVPIPLLNYPRTVA